jgi:hypothetical protein
MDGWLDAAENALNCSLQTAYSLLLTVQSVATPLRLAPDTTLRQLRLAHHHIDHPVRYDHNFPNSFSGSALFDFRGG